MFSMVQRSTPWSNKKNKQRYSEGDQPSTASSTVPLHVYEKLQLQLMEAIDTLAQRESEIASLAAQLKVLHANTSLFSYKIESLEQTIREKDGEIETLENELHALRTDNDGIEQPKKEKKSSNKKSKKVSKSRSSGSLDKLSKPQSSGSLKKSHSRSSSKDKKLSSKKKKTKKRSTMHNHELSKASESMRVNSTRKTSTDYDNGSSSSSCTEDSTNRGSSELFLNPLKANSLDDDLACEKKEELPQEDDSMRSLSMRSASGRRKTLPPFWNFRPVDKPAFLDPTSLEMVDEVSDLTRSYRSEFSVSIWSPSPIVKRRELNLSEADKAALGFTLDSNHNNNNNSTSRHQRRSWSHHHQQVDEQPGDGNLGMSLWLVDEIGTVAEEEEEMNDDEILEDDSIASSNSSISC